MSLSVRTWDGNVFPDTISHNLEIFLNTEKRYRKYSNEFDNSNLLIHMRLFRIYLISGFCFIQDIIVENYSR